MTQSTTSLAPPRLSAPNRAQTLDYATAAPSAPRPLLALPDAGRMLAYAGTAALVLALSWWARDYSFLLFHCLAELFCIVIAAATFLLAWNTRRYHASLWVLLLGVALLAVGVMDLFHMLSYKGMNVFRGVTDANAATELWIASRYLLAASFVAAALLVGVGASANLVRSPLPAGIMLAYSVAVTLLLLAIYEWDAFPKCFDAETGLTPFKKVSEYVISAILIVAGVILWSRRGRLDPQVLAPLLGAIAVAVLTELCFTLYMDVYGLLNWAGHLLKVLSYVLLYQAMVVTGTRRPYALLFRDLGRREADLTQAKAAAERANAAKDQFLAVLSHELRNPLNPVLAHVSDLQSRSDLPPDVRDDLLTIRRNVELEARLIDDLLDSTRISRGKLSLVRAECDLHALVGQAVEICREEARAKHVEFDVELAATRRIIDADAGRMLQVLWNVLKNAVKFSPHRGRVLVRSEDAEGGRVRLSVTDSGVGIAAEDLECIFDAFAQGNAGVTRTFGGLGLGLSISRALVEGHGGRVWAESDGMGRGAKILIELLAESDTDSPAVRVNSRDAMFSTLNSSQQVADAPRDGVDGLDGAASGLSLLLVEDHADTAKIMVRLLQAMGHDVTVTHTVAEAVAAAEAGSFDLVVSDLGLPDGSGLDLMSDLRDRHGLRGLCLTGYGMDEDLERSGAAGFVEHLVKPVSMEALSSALSRASKVG